MKSLLGFFIIFQNHFISLTEYLFCFLTWDKRKNLKNLIYVACNETEAKAKEHKAKCNNFGTEQLTSGPEIVPIYYFVWVDIYTSIANYYTCFTQHKEEQFLDTSTRRAISLSGFSEAQFSSLRQIYFILYLAKK